MIYDRWVSIAGYEGLYEVSNLGQVRSLDRIVGGPHGTQRKRGKILKEKISDRGYSVAWLSKGNRKITARIHQLVARAFLGPQPDGTEVAHKNDNPQDNAASNLEYLTHTENVAQRNQRDRQARGGRNHAKAKLTPQDIPIIRARLGRGHSMAAVGRDYGVTNQNIQAIRNGKTWRHVQ